MPSHSSYKRTFDYINNLYYYICDKFGKENIDRYRFMRVIYFHDRQWLIFACKPYFYESYLLFNNDDFINNIPPGKFDSGKFADIDYDILNKLPITLKELDNLPYAHSIDHREELKQHVLQNSKELLERFEKSGIKTINGVINSFIDLYDEFYDNHLIFYNLKEYNEALNDVNLKNRIYKLNKIKPL